jgi:hypothetical protein
VIQDVKTLGVKNWKNLAMEKERWQKIEEGQDPRRAVEPMMIMMMNTSQSEVNSVYAQFQTDKSMQMLSRGLNISH